MKDNTITGNVPTMTKSKFEDYLFMLNNNETLGYRKYNDLDIETNKNTILHLYYNDNGHIGTWQRGGHFVVFKDRLELPIDDN